MDLLTKADLHALTHDDEHVPAVSLFMPTGRVSVEVQADQLRWKNLLSAVTTFLHDEGMNNAEVDSLLRPARQLHTDVRSWQHMSDGLAVFLRPGWHRIFRVPVDVPQVAAVGDRFNRNLADHGRVETLFVSGEPSCWNDTVGGHPTVVKLGAERDFAPCELFDRSVVSTLSSGGDTYTVADPSMLDGGLMAATFRY